MGYGTYATIADIKGVLGITSTTDDTVMRKIAESVSLSIDNYCNRNFYVTSATKYFDGAGRTLWVPDMLSNSTFKTDDTGDGTYENVLEGTWVASTAYTVGQFVKPITENRHSYKCTSAGTTDSTEPTWGTTLAGTTTDGTITWTCSPTNYILYGGGLGDSYNKLPKTRIAINPEGEYGSFANGVGIGIEIAGSWGYGDGISATPYVVDTTLTADISSTTATTCTVTAITNLSAGNTILIDTEQMYIYSIATLTLTVERGVNGTTAATHQNGASLYIYQYPANIRQACLDLSVALYVNRARQGLQSEKIGDYSYVIRGAIRGGEMVETGMIKSMLDDTIRSYRGLRF